MIMEVNKVKNKLLTGFTIIELLVVVTTIAIIIVIAISNFSEIRLQSYIKNVSYKFNQDLNRARNMASSALVFRDSLGVEQEVDGYGIYIDLNALGDKIYKIYADKTPGNNQYDLSDYIIETIDISAEEPGVFIKDIESVVGENISINFKSSDLGTYITELSINQDYADVIFALENDLTKTRTVSISKFGLIEVK